MIATEALLGLFDENATVGRLPVGKVFTMADQESFARLSGDRNPMHMDFVAARRTQGGGCVVHGVQATLWALEQLAAAGLDVAGAEALNVSFSKFIIVDQAVALHFSRKGTTARAEIVLGGQTAVTIAFKSSSKVAVSTPASTADLSDYPEFDLLERPFEPSPADMQSFVRWISPTGSKAEFEAAYPNACARLGAETIMSISALSSLVGMACPGLNSIFSGFAIQWTASRGQRIGVGARTRSFDDRTRLIQISIEGARFVGTVSAFERMPPVETSLDRVRQRVSPREFAGVRALVVGGSRGLGAATAKLLAAGGAQVTITYFQGAADADRVREELCAAFGPQACATARLDMRDASADQLTNLTRDVTHLYYFATPLIGGQRSGSFDGKAFAQFVDIYVRGFCKVVDAMAGARKGEKLFACYPSSIFVEKRPKQMTEYAMAKAAGEVLCEDLMRNHAGLSIIAPRLPRTLTDQTATVPPVETADAVDVMLPHIRSQMPQPGP
ncbi:MAG TPA: SDR family NAD(P)-dependent oxidoreductase [Rhodoblastus sp.]|nr:SDR family NAD(P)-dependent oxidoreductase [Rhodoblastus sp.]